LNCLVFLSFLKSKIQLITQAILESHNLPAQVENFLKTGNPTSFVQQLCNRVRTRVTKPGITKPGKSSATPIKGAVMTVDYNIPLINSLVLHIGVEAIAKLNAGPSGGSVNNTRSMELLQSMALALDGEGRYHFFNAIANQLRYPNSHTHYFSCVFLYLFAEAREEGLKEQITRVLLERLIVHRPHPWGLLITFIELIKNDRYKFWHHRFTHCEPDIKRLFESVARSCGAGGSAPIGPSAGAPAL
jgi:CCR4-NOT transcription complex subunit 1